MEHLPQLITDLALLLAVAGITTLICKRLKQPLVLGYVIAGFLVSPGIGFIPNIVDTENVQTWSEIGVIFLMFGLGLEFSILKLTTVGKPAIITAAIEMLLMITIGFTCGTLLGWSFYTSLFLGGMLAISSTTIIIKAFDELGLKGKKFSDLVFGALVMEDIGGIFLMVVLSTIAVGTAVDGGDVIFQLGQMVLYLIVWFVLSIILVPTLLQKVAKGLNDEIMLIISIALCLGMVVLANAIGFSAALGAFIAGSILAGTVQAHRIEKLFKPIKDLFGAIFFVSVGMLVSPQLIIDNWVAIVIVTLVTLITKPIASTIGALFSGQPLKTSIQTGLSLSQIGEFSFIIAALGVSLGVTADFLYPVIVTVSVVTTLTTPFYIKNSDKVYGFMVKILPDSLVNRIDRTAENKAQPKENSVWIDYLKHWFIKIIMVVIAALASVELFGKLVKPLLLLVIPEPAVDFIITIIALIFTGLFISNLFQSNRKGDFALFWAESRKHHLPLVMIALLDVLVSAGMVVYIAVAFEGGGAWLIAPALIITLFLARSKAIHSWFLGFEALFVGNLNERMLAERQSENDVEDRIAWAEDRLFITEVKATKLRERRGKSIPIALFIAQACNLDLLALKRNGSSLFEDDLAHLTKNELRQRLADSDDPLNIIKNDTLTFVGTEDEINAFARNMAKAGAIAKDDFWSETLREYLSDEPGCGDLMCFSLMIDASSDFRNRSIDAINFKENYGCLVIGLERNMLPVVKPSKNTRLAQKDLVLLLGKREMAEFFHSATSEVLVTPTQIADSTEAPQCTI